MMKSDQIGSLPINRNMRSSDRDARVMETVFGNGSSQRSFGSLIVPGALFFALSLPFVDRALRKYITASDVLLLAIKTAIFLFALLLFQFIGWA